MGGCGCWTGCGNACTPANETIGPSKAGCGWVKIARIAAFHREPFVGDGLTLPAIAAASDRLHIFDAGSVKISATELRNDLAAGKGLGGRVPGPVAEYITKHGLYSPIPGTAQR